jgi:protein-S-isoprenylcysteine O-methyltransferase Ste14
MYPAAVLVSQQWLIVVLAVMGMASMDQITRNADRELVERFGVDYETYIRQVPRLNIVSGIIRKLRR